MAVSNEFKNRIDVIAIATSQFQDANGIWAKRWENVDRVYVKFADNTEFYLDVDDFHQLPPEQQKKINVAPSSPQYPPL